MRLPCLLILGRLTSQSDLQRLRAMYRIVGADQKEYGPITADQLRQWIGEGRANGQTLVRFEEGPWKPLSTFPEFAADVPRTAPPPLPATGALSLPPPTGTRTNPMAITGLVVSILGFFQCCTPIFALLGLIFSCVGLAQIKRNPAVETGQGMALAGIAVSVLGLIIFVILWVTGVLAHLVHSLSNMR